MLFVAGQLFNGGAVQNAVASLTPDGSVISTNTFRVIERNFEATKAMAPRTKPGFVGATVSIVPGSGQNRSFLYCALNDLSLDPSCGSDGVSEIEVVSGNKHYIGGLARKDGGYVGLGSTCPVGEACQPFVFCVDENLALDKGCTGGGVRMIELGAGDNDGRALIARANGTFLALMNNCVSSVCRPAIACFEADLSPIACE